MNERIVEAEQDVGSIPTISIMKKGALARYFSGAYEDPNNGKLVLVLEYQRGHICKVLIEELIVWVQADDLYYINYETQEADS